MGAFDSLGVQDEVQHVMSSEARAGLYGFFSRIFTKELDEEALALLRSPLGQELLPQTHACGELRASGDPAWIQATFDPDYVHLTVVNVVPYASFYLRDDAMVEGGSSNPVADFMKSFGFEVDLGAARSLAPDHIGIELEFMATLCQAQAEAEGRPDPDYAAKIEDVQRRFLREHLLTWAPVYLFAVERCAHTTVYKEAAHVGLDYIASDYEALSSKDRDE